MSITTKVRHSTFVDELLTDGTYPALLFRLVHIGTLVESYKGTPKSYDKILLSYVIPSHKRLFKETEAAYVVHVEYTLSLWETAKLRKAIVQMKGTDIFRETDSEADYEVTDIIGTPCMLTTKQRPLPNGQAVVEIAGYAPLPDDELMPESPYPLAVLSYKEFDWKLFLSLGKHLRAKIESTPEFRAIPDDVRLNGIENAQNPLQAEDQGYDGDLPF